MGLKKIVFILSAARSGSTLLDKALGSHEACFSMGEITNFADEFGKDQTLCGCGSWLKDCSFWAEVGRVIKGKARVNSLQEFDIKGANASRDMGKIKAFVDYLGLYDSALRRRLLRTQLLYDTIAAVSGKDILIDSSKGVGRSILLGRHLKNYEPFYIHLIRDGKAVLNSNKKQSYSVTLPNGSTQSFFSDKNRKQIKQYIGNWMRYNKKVSRVLRFIPGKAKYFLRYEDFIKQPEKHLIAICHSIGIDYQPKMRALRNDHNHILGGNAARVNAKEILYREQADYSNLTIEDLRLFERITGTYYKKMGYQ
jgi:hypothetical protein